ncbi:L,D-transpeptidase family protein [Candidatus Pelagibacter sp.]|jgi:L,D-peptidoglycan transpeptidase YkuD (ErfK/YbiS/YcfS/YnhG family)|nr:L,D-transpeptidase family protein [Candidatus Pelagibacter sp.]
MIILIKDNTLLFDDFKFKCCIGKNGSSYSKIEGDKRTPKGLYSIGDLFYRADRIKNIKTKLKKIKINKKMGWCDDPNNRKYNKLVTINKTIKCERLFRKNENYDLLIPVKYNFKKSKKKRGSAIFLHLTRNYNKTLGCIAIKKKDMLILLKLINQNTKIKIF